jgi:hypothetical protein
MELYHISENPKLSLLEPGYSKLIPWFSDTHHVFAADIKHLHFYLLPWNCPRLVFSVDADCERSNDQYPLEKESYTKSILAVDSEWLKTIQRKTLYLYLVPFESFKLLSSVNGIFGSPKELTAIKVFPVYNILEYLISLKVEIRLTPSLQQIAAELKNKGIPYYGYGIHKPPMQSIKLINNLNADI